jgi:hypothetical protein
MDAFTEMHRDDGFASAVLPLPSMRPVLGLAVLLTVLIGVAVIGTVWNVPQPELTPDQVWSFVGP